ncbi:hypothetical protein ABTM08_20040, partial [Acinetobacter baumannii]
EQKCSPDCLFQPKAQFFVKVSSGTHMPHAVLPVQAESYSGYIPTPQTTREPPSGHFAKWMLFRRSCLP